MLQYALQIAAVPLDEVFAVEVALAHFGGYIVVGVAVGEAVGHNEINEVGGRQSLRCGGRCGFNAIIKSFFTTATAIQRKSINTRRRIISQ